MCLDTVDKRTKQFKKGWRRFREVNGKLYPPVMDTATVGQKHYPVNRWFRDVRKRPATIEANDGTRYPCGIHFYEGDDDFRFYNMYKIKVRNVVASGWQDGNRVGVAKEIFIEEKV